MAQDTTDQTRYAAELATYWQEAKRTRRAKLHAIRRTRWTKLCPKGCGNLCDRDSEMCRPCRLRVVRPSHVLAGHVIRAGTCLEGDECPRFHCLDCGQYWLGTLAHPCPKARR